MRVLVTGADGFVGRWLVPLLVREGHAVTALVRGAATGTVNWRVLAGETVPERVLELTDAESVSGAVSCGADAVIHLAAVASARDALDDPGGAWVVNAAGTARLCDALGRMVKAGEADPLLLVVSSAEVYAPTDAVPVSESAPVAPRNPYGASKAGAELAAREAAGRWGLRTIIVRPFPHTGPGQEERFAIPAFARRLRVAARAEVRVVKVGNLDPVRDLLDVRDVAAAYLALVARGVAGETFNVASGRGYSMGEIFSRLAAIQGVDAVAVPDPALVRPSDLPWLVGDATRLREATGWQPAIPLDQTLRDVVNAQAD